MANKKPQEQFITALRDVNIDLTCYHPNLAKPHSLALRGTPSGKPGLVNDNRS